MSKNKKFTAKEIITQIDLINHLFSQSRSHFPYIPDKQLRKGYVRLNFKLIQSEVKYGFKNLTEKDQLSFNSQGHFLNQNYIVRLFAVLQYFGIYNNFDEHKYKKLAVLKGLRNEFTHGLGAYNPKSSKDRKLLKQIITVFKLPQQDYKNFPINIDTVISRIIQEAKQFVKEHYP